MILFKQKHLWLLCMVAMVAYFSFAHIKCAQDGQVAFGDADEWEKRIAYEQQYSQDLDRLSEKASSQKTIESIARNNLNYLKEGEILFVDNSNQ